ncbi:MAG: hypothetical protein AB8B97_08360 [Granulosicoccus sp.]
MNQANRSIPLSVPEGETIPCTRPVGVDRLPEKKDRADISIALDPVVVDEIRKFRKREYQPVYPGMDLDNDVLDRQALILYSRNISGDINSTARLSFDGPHPLPEEKYLRDYRRSGQRVMELGRFVSKRGGLQLLKNYYRAFYSVAQRTGCDVIVMAMQPGHIRFHERKMGVNILQLETGVTYGGKHNLACVAWEIKKTQPQFHQWIAS